MTRTISPAGAMTLLNGTEELAFLDVREAGPFSVGHPLFAVPCPWSTFEAEVVRLVPRRNVPVLLIDGGDGIAAEAAVAMQELGYSDVSLIEGGAPGWAGEGFTLFKGVHVPSKTLGELAEETMHPKAVHPDELARWMAEKRSVLFYDCRPADEHAKMTVPGARSLPNGELPHRLEMLPHDRPIVVTCAGRTRGIIAVASLGLVAPEREIYWLEDGTQGWTLSGRALACDVPPTAPPALNAPAKRATRRRAATFMAREAIDSATASDVARFANEVDRTTYFFDVRSPAETEVDALPGFTSLPVVTLVQATDRAMGVRRARVILADDLGLRGALAAYWLRALGYETAVVEISDELRAVDVPRDTNAATWRFPLISAEDALAESARNEACFVDMRPSSVHSAGHVQGAIWSIRPRLKEIPETTKRICLIGDGTAVAHLACDSLKKMGRRNVAVVEGGMDALIAAGAPLDTADPIPISEAWDVVSFAHGRHAGNMEASRHYLAWEKGLVSQLDAAERAMFAI